ncbi:hypothetical protein ykris0001_25570 [Yersinia kristensenii ATCC 33638]|nr:hypothetical protein ykris0001_25570 [Yersinia kristensenii ATCC 33638]
MFFSARPIYFSVRKDGKQGLPMDGRSNQCSQHRCNLKDDDGYKGIHYDKLHPT